MRAHVVRSSIALTLALTPLAALPLSAQSTGALSGRVTDQRTGQPLEGATIFVGGTQLGAISRSDGSYLVRVQPGRYEVRARLLGYAMARDSATIVAGETVSLNFGLEKAAVSLNEVVVIGTRRTDRTVLTAPVPIDVLTAEDIEATGLTETSQIIQLLAPSFNFPRPTVTDGTDHVRPSTLRGLGPDQVLVLVNGKRRHQSALIHINSSVGRGSTGVDLNAIPASAIDRIEILRDGAAAQYGSDAIAGVINIILRGGTQGDIQSTLGQTSEGDGTVFQAAAGDGLQIGQNGFVYLSGEYRDRQRTNRSGRDPRQQYFTGDPRNDAVPFDLRNHRHGDAETNDAGIFLNSSLPLASGMQAYAFGGITRREGDATGFFRRPSDDRTVRAIHPNGFLPAIVTEIWDGSGAAGLRGAMAGWRWDLSSVFGSNSFEFNVENSNNTSMGTASPTSFYAGTLSFNQWTTNLDLVREVRLAAMAPFSLAVGAEYRRDGYQIEAGDSASWKHGGVPILDGPNAGNVAAPGAQVFPGWQPSNETDQSRSNVGVYVDLESNLAERLLMGIAARYENYSDFGSTTTGKVAARLELFRGVALRGAAQTGFRAPSLAQSFFSATSTNFLGSPPQPFEVRTFPVNTEEAQILGARALEPEKSINYSAGLTLEPIRNLALTVDAYRIDIDDRIVLSGNFVGDSVQRLFENRGFTGIRGGRYFTNAIDTRTKGIDVILRYGIGLGEASTLRLTGGYNHTATKVTHVDPTPPALGQFQEQLFDRIERGRIESGQPRNSAKLSVNYEHRNLGVALHNSHYGQVTFRASGARGDTTSLGVPADQRFGPRLITDLDLSYRFFDRLTLAAGAQNLFDVYPARNFRDPNNRDNSNFGIFVYNGISPFGFNGRFVYGRVAYRL